MLAPGAYINPAEKWQRLVKAELLLEGAGALQFDAMTIGNADLVFGKDFLLAQARKHNLPYLGANLQDAASGKAIFPAYTVKTLGKLKVGVVGLVPETLDTEGLKGTPALPALQAAVQELKAQQVDVIVALSNQGFGVNEKLAEAVPELEVIVSGGTKQKLDVPKVVGNAVLLEAGNRGKHQGFFEATRLQDTLGWQNTGPQSEQSSRRSQLVQRVDLLQKRLQSSSDEAERRRLVGQIAHYNSELSQMNAPTEPGKVARKNLFQNVQEPLSRTVEDEPEMKVRVDRALTKLNAPPPEGQELAALQPVPALTGDVVGSQACAGCHAKEYEQWKTTPHARAYATLEKLNRNNDYQCFSCHVTGSFLPGGPIDPRQVTAELQNVGCESCHMPGKNHLSNPAANKLPAQVPETLCLQCHTKEQTGGRFVYSEYLPKVVHALTTAPAAHP